MRFPSSLALLLAAGCASGTPPLGATDRNVHLGDAGGGVLRMSGSDGARVSTVAAPIDKVWRILPAVYDSLGIALTDHNATTRLIGNSGMKAHKTLGSVSLSKYLDCGATQGFPSADSYEIQMSVRTQVTEKDGGTALGTLVEAVGKPMAFGGSPVRCSTRGVLETRIAEGVKALLGP